MTRPDRIVVWVVAALFAAAPVLVLAAQLCTGCCCPPSPCHGEGTAAPCGSEIATAPCCDEALPVLPWAAKRSADGPAFQLAAAERWLPAPNLRPSLPGIAPDPGARTSPLRLSVVLRI